MAKLSVSCAYANFSHFENFLSVQMPHSNSQKTVYYCLVITLWKSEYCLIWALNKSTLFDSNSLKMSVLFDNDIKFGKACIAWKAILEKLVLFVSLASSIVCRSAPTTPSTDNPPIWLDDHPVSLFIFFQTSRFCQDFSDNIAPLKYRINIKINSCGSYSFIFRRLKNKDKCFFYKQHFYKQNLADI